MRHSSTLICGIVVAVLILDAVHARPSPEAALSGGYSYNPPSHQGWRGMARGSDVSIERVPLRLVHHSTTQLNRPPPHHYPSSGPARRGPFHFPSGPQQQYHRRPFVFPSGSESFRNELNPYARNDLPSYERSTNLPPFDRYSLPFSQTPKNDYLPPSSPSTGYNYDPPTTGAWTTTTTTEMPTTTTMLPEETTTLSENERPRIAIAISKSTVIHTGKGSFQIDEKTGLPKPLKAEAHSFATIPADNSTPKADSLSGEGTGNFPIITKGTPPDDEEPITESQDPVTEPASTAAPATAPTADSTPFATSWPHYGAQQSYSVIAPGQAQFVSLGHANPAVVSFAQNNLVPAYIQPEFAHPTYRSAYHPYAAPSAAAYYPAVFQPYLANYANLIEYAPVDPNHHVLQQQPQHDLCKEKAVPQAAAVVPTTVAVVPTAKAHQEAKSGRIVINRGGIAIAGPGGVADSGEGGTSIVGPGGTVYSSPNGISVVGPGGKVVMQGDGTERILARGPIVYYHQP